MTRDRVAAVPGVAGSDLAPDVVERLPDPAGVAPAPWPLGASVIVWTARVRRAAARAALQPGIDGTPLLVAGQILRYDHTPVGAYAEVMGAIALWRRRRIDAHIPFIAVDSDTSIVGGRSNWALPKTLARFRGDVRADRAMVAEHPQWRVAVRARPLGPALRIGLPFAIVQAHAGAAPQRAAGSARLRVRPALVRVRVSGPPALTGWLRSGVFCGGVVEQFEGTLGPLGD